AAGITKYKKHRRDAERKMDQTRQNLLRVTDIVSEIDRTRSSLKRQAAKAERFIVYREELEELMLYQSSHQLLEFVVVDRVEREALGTASTQTTELRLRVTEGDTALGVSRAEAAGIEERCDACSQSAFRADNDVSALAAELTRAHDQLTHLDQRLRTAAEEKDQLGLRLAQLGAEREDLDGRRRSLEADAEARKEDALNEERALAELKDEESN